MLPRLGAWVVLLLSGLFLLTTGGTYPGIASVEGHILGQVIGYVVLGTWLVAAFLRREWRPTTPLFLPVIAATGAYVLAAVASQRPRLSFEPTIAGFGWALGFLFLTCLLARPWFRARVAVLLTAFVAIVAFGYIVQVSVEWINWWRLIGRFAIPPLRPSFAALFLGSPNLIATALILASPLVVVLAWTRPRQRSLAVALAVASALAIFASGSRSAWLGVALAVLVALALWVTRARPSLSGADARIKKRRTLALPIAFVLVIAVFAPSILQRFGQGGADLRFDLWRTALLIFFDHPALGSGPGTWVQLKVEANPVGVPNLILPHAHNMYVQAAAEVGILGLLALSLLVIAMGRRLRSGWRSTERAISLEAAAVTVSMTAFAGQSIFDNLSNLPFVILLVALIVAWVDGRLAAASISTGNRQSAGARARILGLEIPQLLAAGGLAAFAVLLPTLIRIDAAAMGSQAGDAYALQGNWQLALDRYDGARRQDPDFTLYELQTAGALARVGRHQEALAMLEEAVKFDQVPINITGLAALKLELGDRAGSSRDVGIAMLRGYGDPAVALNAGLIAERLGDTDRALYNFANAVLWDPALASADVWTSPARSVSKDDVVAAARERASPFDAALILAYAGDTTAAQGELRALPASPTRDAYLATIIGVSGDAATAFAMFDMLLDANPSDWFAAALAARVARRLGFAVEANRYSTWAATVQGDAAPGVVEEASVAPAAPDDPSASLPLNYPWSTYLRPISPFIVMPELTLIGVK